MTDTSIDRAEALAANILADAPPDRVRAVVIALGALAGVQDVAGRYACWGGEWPDIYPMWIDEIRRIICAIESTPTADPSHTARVAALRAMIVYAHTIDLSTTAQ